MISNLLLAATILLLLWFLAHYNFWRPRAAPDLPRILMYHSVGPGEATGMNIPTGRFEQQLIQLQKSGFTALTLSELGSDMATEKPVALTFDDGFRNNYTQAFPLLRKYGMKATVFLSPDIEGIEKLGPEEIREMADSGLIEFGGHTMTHINLTTVDDETAKREIESSVESVAKLTGKPCRTFAYPFGRYQPKHVTMLKQAGIEMAVTVKKRIRPLKNPLEIPRLSVHGKANKLQFHLILTRGRYRV
ncbi:MAG: polysaccharide deacetylase family protein [Gammaproteobacteria bacterium]|nr:polysaccharide deacetylase family protein [Gammaproteobacteria bacterium]